MSDAGKKKKKETKYSSDFKITDIPMKMNFKNWLIYQLLLLPEKNILQLFEHVLILYAGCQKSKRLVRFLTFAIKHDLKL